MIPEEMLLKAREKAYVSLIQLCEAQSAAPWEVKMQAAALLLAATERDLWGLQGDEHEVEHEDLDRGDSDPDSGSYLERQGVPTAANPGG